MGPILSSTIGWMFLLYRKKKWEKVSWVDELDLQSTDLYKLLFSLFPALLGGSSNPPPHPPGATSQTLQLSWPLPPPTVKTAPISFCQMLLPTGLCDTHLCRLTVWRSKKNVGFWSSCFGFSSSSAPNRLNDLEQITYALRALVFSFVKWWGWKEPERYFQLSFFPAICVLHLILFSGENFHCCFLHSAVTFGD